MNTEVLNPEVMRNAAAEAVSMLKLMANEDRLLLLCQLSQRELCVSDIEQSLDIRQPTLSQQLAVLRNEGVVETRREGKRIFYRVADEKLVRMLSVMYELYCPQGD